SLSIVRLVWPRHRTNKHEPHHLTIFHDNCGFFLLDIYAQRTTLRAGIHDRIRGIVRPLYPRWVCEWTFVPAREEERKTQECGFVPSMGTRQSAQARVRDFRSMSATGSASQAGAGAVDADTREWPMAGTWLRSREGGT